MEKNHDCSFKKINVLSEPNAEILPYHSRIQGDSETHNISDISFEDIRIFGKAAITTTKK